MSYEEEVTPVQKQQEDWRPGDLPPPLEWTKKDEKLAGNGVRFNRVTFEMEPRNGRKPATPTPRRGDPANKRHSWQW